jgi:hypothetical protein
MVGHRIAIARDVGRIDAVDLHLIVVRGDVEAARVRQIPFAKSSYTEWLMCAVTN